jgi:hypothetical protein
MSKQFSFADVAKQGDTGSYLKLKEGNNIIRVVSEFLLYESTFTNQQTGETKKTKKFVGYVLDRADGTFKPAFLARTIVGKIGDLQLSPGCEFDGVPMPYDVNVRANGAGTIDVEYNVIPMPRSDLTADELAEVSKLDVAEFIASLDREQGAQPAPAESSQQVAKPMSPEEEAALKSTGSAIPV